MKQRILEFKEGKAKLMLSLALDQSNVKAVEIEARSHALDDLSARRI